MWAPFFASILMSLLKRKDEEEEKRKSLGLGEQMELSIKTRLLPRPGDMLIPVQIWSDGAGIWRIIGEEDIPPLSSRGNEAGAAGWSKISRAREDMRYFERDLDHSGSDLDLYVYLDDSSHGNRPSSIIVTTSPENAGPPDVVRIFLATSHRQEDKSWIRWRDFLARWRELGTDVEHIDGPAMVPDSAIEAMNQICQGSDPERVSKQVPEKIVRDWIDTFVELRNNLEDIENLFREVGRIEDLNEPDPDSVDEETLAQIEEENEENGYSRTLERWKEGQIEFVYDEIREKREETDALLREEAWAAEKLMEISGQNISVSVHPRRNHTEITVSGEDISHTQIVFHEEGSWFDVEERRVRNSAQPGVLGSLYSVGLIETESERKKRQEEIVWKFPGEISGVWEMWSLLGQFRPTGEEPMFPLIKIAFDHGLLSPAAQERFEKVLSLWNDENLGRLMHENSLIQD